MHIDKPPIQTLSDSQLRSLHDASLQILAKTGILLHHPQSVERLTDHGATINERGRLCIPADLVEQTLNLTPKTIPLYNRSGKLALDLRPDEIYFGTGSDTIYTIDPVTGERRHATSRDVQRMAGLCDVLPNLSFVMSMGVAWDVPEADTYLHGFISMLRGTEKPVVFTAADRRDIEHIWRIACELSGGEEQLRQKPFLMNYSEPISPLLFPQDSVEKLTFCVEKGIPVAYVPSPNIGGGGPVTMAGALALANAEILAGMVIAQLTSPGAYTLYGANVAALDMRAAVVSYGAPEWALSTAAMTDLARFYGLPCWGYGGASDAKSVDAQAGLEAYQSISSAFLTQSALNHDVGYIESGLTSSMEMILLADEIISMVSYISRGVEINANTLALDVIDQVTPGSGFLAEEHTARNLRKALFLPKRLNRERYENWHQAGGMDMYQRLNVEVRKMLDSQEEKPLGENVEALIQETIKERGGPENKD